MTPDHWHDRRLATLGWLLNGEQLRGHGPQGEAVADRSFLVWLHGGPEPVELVAPGDGWPDTWQVLLDTSGTHSGRTEPVRSGDSLRVPARTLLLLGASDDGPAGAGTPPAIRR